MQRNHTIAPPLGNTSRIEAESALAAANDLKKTLQEINRAANSLEIFSYSAAASIDGTYGTEDEAYTQRRISDVLMMLERLQELHTELKRVKS